MVFFVLDRYTMTSTVGSMTPSQHHETQATVYIFTHRYQVTLLLDTYTSTKTAWLGFCSVRDKPDEELYRA